MQPKLEIVDILLSPPRLTDPDLERGDRQPWTDVGITIRNHYEREAVYVVSMVTQLDYDLATRTLVLGMVIPRSEPERGQLRRTAPSTVRVEPSESVVMHVAVPLVIRRFVEGGGLGGTIETMDASGVEHVTCRVAWGDSPMPEVWAASVDEMERRLATWEKTIEETFDRKLPGERQKRTPHRKRG